MIAWQHHLYGMKERKKDILTFSKAKLRFCPIGDQKYDIFYVIHAKVSSNYQCSRTLLTKETINLNIVITR